MQPHSLTPKKGLIALYTATCILGINGVLSKAIALDAITITFMRCVIAFAALAIILLAQKSKNLFKLNDNRNFIFVLIIGALMSVHWSSFFHSMQISTVAIGILAHYSYPVITVIVEPLLDKKLPRPQDMGAALLVVIGVALIAPSWDIHGSAVAGVLFGLLSAITWAARNIITRRYLSKEAGQSIMTYQLLVIIIFTAGFANTGAIANASTQTWLMLLLLGIVSTAIGHTLVVISLRVLSAKSVSLISCLQPPIAIALSGLILHEFPALTTLLGGTLILCVAFYEAIKIKTQQQT
ncbi:MAG: DMT family transporter [Marinagarivorans sp.]|nr:DMT family transporter [Marinagarivorans sp.]